MPTTRFVRDIKPEDTPRVKYRGPFNDPLAQPFLPHEIIDPPLLTFEGLANVNNSGPAVPPDPDGAVGPTRYVEMVNSIFAVYTKLGVRVAGPTRIGSLWAGFAISDCANDYGDPVVLYDHFANRWLLSQFALAGPIDYNCVAISKTGDPAGAYYRYAFSAGQNFPDYPKYGVWGDSYLLTSRDFGNGGGYGISVYGLEKKKMIVGNPAARSVHFFLDSAVHPTYTMGDGLLPADVDGPTVPADGAPAPIIGDMNTRGPYAAPFDALNVYDLTIHWATATGTLTPVDTVEVAPFDSTFPCAGRSCIAQPGTSQGIDILSYRQRPTFRLAYRKHATFEDMVTNRSVQARPGIAGVRWYEIRRVAGEYTLFQQGTYAPPDGVNRWMGSAAQDKLGNIGLGFSVSNATTVFPGIRYTGRLVGDPLGMMTLGEAVMFPGHGSQTTGFGRWGDYTALTLDPVDDCTFWYVNEYYAATSDSNWQTRIGSFKLPGCNDTARLRTFRK